MFQDFKYLTNLQKLEFAKYFLDNHKSYILKSRFEYLDFLKLQGFLEPRKYFEIREKEIRDREEDPMGRSKSIIRNVYIIEIVDRMIESEYQTLKKLYE